MAAKKHPIFDTATTLGKLMLFLGVSSICGVLIAGLMVPAVALTGNTATSSINFFDQLPDDMTVGVPAQSSVVLASDGSVLAKFYDQNRTEVKLAAISPFMKNAIIAVEDSRYYEHGGIDTKGLLRAVSAMAQGGDRQGASTITQQYVNNVIIQTYAANGEKDKIKLGAAKTTGDKVREIKLAIAMEKKYSKDDILQGYLNWVYFANNNYGIESAASYYFGVHAKDLTLPQAATLAGVVNSPTYYDPVANPDHAVSRRNMVLDRMLDQKKIDKKQHDAAVKAKIDLKITPNQAGCATAVRGEYFCQYVTNLILNDPVYGKTKADREKLLAQGGLTIKTTLDPKLQDAAQAQFANFTPMNNNPDKVGQALVTVQPLTGKILAMAQNTKINAPKGQWSSDYNFAVDRVDTKGQSLGGAGGFDVGSTIKPFTFAEWLNDGHKINEMVDASVRKYPVGYPWVNTCGTSKGIYDSNYPGSTDLQNAEEGWYRRLTAREGLYNSLNTATMYTASKLDLCNIQKMMTAAGIHLGENPNKPYDLSNTSSLLGSGEVAPLTMASAFATFASGGVHCDPIALVSITNAKGDKFPVPSANCKQTIKPEVAAGVVSVLQEVLVRGSGYQIPLNFPAGAKTGTTNDSQQTWTTGFTKGLVTSSWLGSPENKNRGNNDKLIAGTRIPYVDGATYAGKAWQGYMNAVAGSFDTGAFPAPPASMVNPIVVAPPTPVTPAPNTGNDKGNNTKPPAPTPKKKD
ncbi:membrane peptidoglycan carboxypeptidase [Arthrobacter silviterrae]|uniref:Penicillin-binding protein n=1 Tax=Arthrobacter silviterrae TaxID=2026658 RepID=A0ABX0DCY4_9MICC|nr:MULTISPECIES: transglycosylase domain-containing protein [Arthrobacter]MCU6478946.1 transglycosylase domain-containing protein [Arthrobacter sp. A2-55]MDQ0277936.1 membrane peptidoglycan carboxypeptidase [Arthrobacter silviterrae]NGN84772.1 penicillin-binding protein [Arthrobacter silviterrae]